MKITIYVPKKGKWRYKVGSKGGLNVRGTPYTLLKSIKSICSRLVEKEKTSIRVRYTTHSDNETISSQNASYLFWATACFLEDYVSKNIFNKIEKKYLGGEL